MVTGRLLAALLVTAVLGTGTAVAQDPMELPDGDAGHVPSEARAGSPPLVKWGKWALLAGSLAMDLAAADAHREADDVYDALATRCSADEALCIAGEDGEYLNPETEALYQRSLSYDRRARRWLIGGQAALLGAAALFIYEFALPDGLPENIPFDPEVEVGARETRIGVSVRF